ncbi:MAG: hypothetical protein KAS17_05775, partial [Victivallaceae bacterium]|nr:hypothetical protein [Victivallaceae bacterium]
QIKMTENAKSPQKINLKSQRPEVFHALFKKIYLGCGIVRDNTLPVAAHNHMTVQSMASGSPGAPLSDIVIEDTGGYIIDKYNTVANPDERRTRASVADELLPVTPAAYPDAVREELIGKIINLTKIGGKVDDFLIIILAQTIKDIGGTIYKYSADETQSGTLACTLGTFDAVINLTNPEQSIYFDEITAEQKIVVKGCRGDDGSIKITSFQYIE